MHRLQIILLLWILLWANNGYAKQILLVFTAEWCGPCNTFKKDLAENPDLVAGYELDIVDYDLGREMAQDFGVQSVPTFIILNSENDDIKKEDESRRAVGYTGQRALQRWLNKTNRSRYTILR